MNAADLAVFDALFASVAEEMGAALERAATSTNIKERRDLGLQGGIQCHGAGGLNFERPPAKIQTADFYRAAFLLPYRQRV